MNDVRRNRPHPFFGLPTGLLLPFLVACAACNSESAQERRMQSVLEHHKAVLLECHKYSAVVDAVQAKIIAQEPLTQEDTRQLAVAGARLKECTQAWRLRVIRDQGVTRVSQSIRDRAIERWVWDSESRQAKAKRGKQ